MVDECRVRYITLGQQHVHSIGGKTVDKDCVVKVTATRERVMEVFEGKFHGDYSQEEFDTQDIMQYFPKGIVEVVI